MIKDFVDLSQFSGPQLQALIDRSIADKALFRRGKLTPTLQHRTLAMIFEKPSLRTRVSFETAMTHLGGHAIYMTQSDIGLGKRESAEDIAAVLGRMCDGIMARTFRHDLVEQLARHSRSPVINALTDFSHPCQAMADLMTAQEQLGPLGGRKLVFIGDGNNVARSLATGCAALNMDFVLAAPEGYELEQEFVDRLPPGRYRLVRDPARAVAGADVLYTDTWVSMGQEQEVQKRKSDLARFQINADLMAAAPPHAIVMHCLPAYKGNEITEDVFAAHAETIFSEAENRLHFQRSLLNVLMAEGGIP